MVYVKENKIFKIVEKKENYNRPFNYDKETAEELGDREWFDETKSIFTDTIVISHKNKCYQFINNEECNASAAFIDYYKRLINEYNSIV